MAGLNRVEIIGNLGRDPEIRTTTSGTPVCNFSVAVSEKWTDRQSGEQKESTEWFSCVAFDKVASNASQWLAKGNKVFCEGKLKTASWNDKATGDKRYKAELHVFRFINLTPRPPGNYQQAQPQAQQQAVPGTTSYQPQQQAIPSVPAGDGDVPF